MIDEFHYEKLEESNMIFDQQLQVQRSAFLSGEEAKERELGLERQKMFLAIKPRFSARHSTSISDEGSIRMNNLNFSKFLPDLLIAKKDIGLVKLFSQLKLDSMTQREPRFIKNLTKILVSSKLLFLF